MQIFCPYITFMCFVAALVRPLRHFPLCTPVLSDVVCSHASPSCSCSRRILWEPFGSRDDPAVLIWNVVKHKAMSRHARYIDNAPRPARDGLIVDYRDNSSANTLLHRFRMPACLLLPGTSLPLYLPKELEWLKLTEEETRLAEVTGFLCVKGRSGTGKTLIALHRMLLKARQARHQKHTLRQAYVARNNRLCQRVMKKFPSSLQRPSNQNPNGRPEATFFIMPQLVEYLEECAVRDPGQQGLWQADQKPVRFPRFKTWYSQRPVPSTTAIVLTARQVWTEIQSIIQGSDTECCFMTHYLSTMKRIEWHKTELFGIACVG